MIADILYTVAAILALLIAWELIGWFAQWLHTRRAKRERDAEVQAMDALLEYRQHSDDEFAQRQRKIRGELH